MMHILITSAASKCLLVRAVKAAAQRFEVANTLAPNSITLFTGDIQNVVPASAFADAHIKLPNDKDLTLQTILPLLQDKGIGLIIPTRDGELAFYAAIADTLKEHGITVMVSGPPVIDLCLDKYRFAASLQQHNLPAIPTAIEAPSPDSPGLFVVKERVGAASENLALGLSALDAISFAANLTAPIFQPYIVGTEYSIDVYSTFDGQTVGSVVRERTKVVNGEAKITTTVTAPRLQQLVEQAARHIGVVGHTIWQALQTEAGDIFIIECNPRFGGASNAALQVGLDSFYWLMQETSGQHIAQQDFKRLDHNIIHEKIDTDFQCTTVRSAG